MAIQLFAQQSSLMSMFTGRELYVIPAYQRPYSWGLDQCAQLYDDIIAAYNQKMDYFLGNVVLAVSERETGVKKPRVVDGQQRITTIWLMYKAVSTIFPDMKVLKDALCTYNWDGSQSEKKIRSEIYESDNEATLKEIYEWDYKRMSEVLATTLNRQGKPEFRRAGNALKTNLIFFFHRFVEFNENYGQKELAQFLRFTLERVTLLPIELSGTTMADAEGKALTIFETINNRGMNLQDADIFKAKLYNKATTEKGKKDFISRWQALKESCDARGKTIDDLFRFYSHIERGLAGITRNEIGLREFFTSADSVLNRKGYEEIMDELERIDAVLQRYDMEACRETSLAKWLQLINIYTNAFPKYAAVAYLYRNGFDNIRELEKTMKDIVRYCYSMGSTTYVKYGIYYIIRQVMNGQKIEIVPKDVNEFSFIYLGKLKWGYALLAEYLQREAAWRHFCCDHVLSARDIQHMGGSWSEERWEFAADCLGNLMVAGTQKYSPNYAEKRNYYMNTCGRELREFFMKNPEKVGYDAISERDSIQISKIIAFLKEKDN